MITMDFASARELIKQNLSEVSFRLEDSDEDELRVIWRGDKYTVTRDDIQEILVIVSQNGNAYGSAADLNL